MESLGARLIAYLQSPLLPRGNRALATRWLPSVAAAVLLAVLLVHAFSPKGLSISELALHVFSIWLGFLLGMILAGILVFRLLPMAARQPTVGWLWLVSSLGFVFGLLLTAGIDSIGGTLRDTAVKAASIHGSQSMLLRLLPVWALVTAFLVRSELLDAYESRFGTLITQNPPSGAGSRPSTVVSLGAGESAIEVEACSIVLISAEENYCQVFVLKGSSLSSSLVRSTLQSIEQTLPADQFMRVHRSHLVNIDQVESIRRQGRRFAVEMHHLADAVPVSRSRLDIVLRRLGI